MTNGASPQQYHQDHKALSVTIDGCFIQTAETQSYLMGYMCTRVGNIRDYYLPFYHSFMMLYTMTSGHKEMEPFKSISDEIRRWGTPSNHITPEKCMRGINLFFEWKDALFKSGILSMRK